MRLAPIAVLCFALLLVAACYAVRPNQPSLEDDGLPDEMQEKLADRYAELFSIFHKYKDKVARVTFWGVYDKTSWLNDWPVYGRTSYPLLFDRHYQPKPAFFAVVKTAQGKQ